MFNKPGEKLQSIAILLLIIGIVCTLFLALGNSYDSYKSGSYTYYSSGFKFESFFITLLVGTISSYISSIVLYGFGTAIEDLATIKSYICKSNATFEDTSNIENAPMTNENEKGIKHGQSD